MLVKKVGQYETHFGPQSFAETDYVVDGLDP